ncbi:hypothetical protein J3D47_002815 [Pseudomonas laurylsulfativorans]|uniref:hypothetical protein n=1 Tax=Pseudomonas laurylsulfativorans TaxID=1943631 RepID=UPI0020A07D46|nr:hypothetical protein [Pseudomonas laurylsulfativorans]MCP1418572.1 hypothetical protein [Pseudomonas laurylsulfativorans]
MSALKNDLKILEENILSDKSRSADVWQATFKAELTESDFEEVIGEVEFNGRFTVEWQRYFYGYVPEMHPDDWVIRVDFPHFNYKLNVDYPVDTDVIYALLVEGGSSMRRGGVIVGGTFRILEMNPLEGKVHGQFNNVWTEPWQPDGVEVPPAYARIISFRSNGKKL